MSAVACLGGEVLRGVSFGGIACRVGRAADSTAPPGAAGAPSPGQDDTAERRGFEEGYERGHAEGLDSGRREGLRLGHVEAAEHGRAAIEEAVAQAVAPLRQEQEKLQALVRSLSGSADAYLGAAEDEVVSLCFETLCAVLGRCVADETAVRAHLSHVLTLRHGPGVATLHVHPQDAALLDRLGLDLAEAGEVHWVADPSVAMGGAIVAGRGGGLDARLETVLAGIKSRLLEARAKRAPMRQEGTA